MEDIHEIPPNQSSNIPEDLRNPNLATLWGNIFIHYENLGRTNVLAMGGCVVDVSECNGTRGSRYAHDS